MLKEIFTLTLYELKQLQASKSWKRFTYLSENQPDYMTAAPVKLNLSFAQMAVNYTPGLCWLFFKGNGGTLRIDNVERVSVEPHILGDVLEVLCRDGQCFTVIAR